MIDNSQAIAEARALLAPPRDEGSLWATLGATALAATASVLLAGAIILGPGFELPPAEAVIAAS